MSNGERNSKRWIEITSATQAAYVTPAEAANNIPSSYEESKNLPLRSSRLAKTVVAPTANTTTTTAAGNKDAAGKYFDSDSARVVQRVTARPGQIQTQIAKISYSNKADKIPHLSAQFVKPLTTLMQRVCHVESSTPSTSPCRKQCVGSDKVVVHASRIDEYAKKKKQRQQEMRALNEILKEVSTNAPPVSKEAPGRLAILTTPTQKHSLSHKAAKENIPSTEYEQTEHSEYGASSPTFSKTSFQRSKTDNNLVATKATETYRRNQERMAPTNRRSKSSQLPASKFSEPGGSPEKKVSSRNREETRRFMEEQRKRRSLEAFNTYRSQMQSAKEKEQIKQRLESLRKQSRRIVSKNIKNAQKRTGGNTAAVAGEASPSQTPKMDLIAKRSQEKKSAINEETAAKQISINKCQKTEPQESEKAANHQENMGAKSNEVKCEEKSNALSSALMENQKRIGLLRKPEIKDHSFSAIKEFSFDKENVALELLTPKLCTQEEGPYATVTAAPPCTPVSNIEPEEHMIAEEQQQEKEQRPDKSEEMSHNFLAHFSEPEQISGEKQGQQEACNKYLQEDRGLTTEEPIPLHSFRSSTYDLKIPSSYLRISATVHEQATQVKDSASLMGVTENEQELEPEKGASPTAHTSMFKERTELPLWLKPSAVQIYPFNFIMAVRRKLDAIVNPPPMAPNKNCNIAADAENEHTCTTAGEDKEPRPLKIAAAAALPSSSKNQTSSCAAQKLCTPSTSEGDDDAIDSNGDSSASGKTHIISSTNDSKRPSILLHKEDAHDGELREKLPPLRSQTLSDITTNFSSISLQLAASHNGGSEISSIKSFSKASLIKHGHIKSQKGNDDTTISSSVFNSPEKKYRRRLDDKECFKIPRRPVSPLSVERIEHLRINSKKLAASTASNSQHMIITTNDHRSLGKRQSTSVNITEVEVDFNSLLKDFNQSLSHVIEVNQQLKTTIDKSQQMFGAERKLTKDRGDSVQRTSEIEYSTDFESAASSLTHGEAGVAAAKEMATEMKPARNKSLFELNTVQPLSNYSTSGDESNAPAPASSSKERNEHLNLNLESIETCSDSTRSDSIFPQNSDSLDGRSNTNEPAKCALERGNVVTGDKYLEAQKLQNQQLNIEKVKDSKKELRKSGQNEGKCMALSADKLKISEKSVESATLDLSKEKNSKKADSSGSKMDPACVKKAERNKKPILRSGGDGDVDDSASAHTRSSDSDITAKHNSVTDDSVCTLSHESNSDTSDQKPATVERRKVAAVNSSKSSTARKSLDFGDAGSIVEELEGSVQMPSSRSNESLAPYRRSAKISKSQPSQPKNVTPRKSRNETSETQQQFINAHVNRSRGDFLLNESRPQAEELKRDNNILKTGETSGSDNHTTGSTMPLSNYAAATEASQPKRIPATTSHSKRITTRSIGSSLNTANKGLGRGQELVTVFNQSDVEVSIISSHNGSISETSLNYSSVGLYEKLIQNEDTKSEHLTTLLKMREKALIDRTKGQIAWLEVQKERYKQRGLLMQIAAIKKKQRGILMKMEKEREGIKRLLQTTNNSTSSTHSSARPSQSHHSVKHQQITSTRHTHDDLRNPPPVLPPLPLVPKSARSSGVARQQQQQHHHRQHCNTSSTTAAHSTPIVRANYDLESSDILEDLLQRREADLRRRREHVERLILWHQRLDQEEAEVQQLERMLLNCNNANVQPQQQQQQPSEGKHYSPPVFAPKSKSAASKKSLSSQQQQQQHTIAAATEHQNNSEQQRHAAAARETKMERRLKEIDRSLRELSSISINKNTSATSADESAASESDYVRTSGSKLNKLWRRLTTQQEDRFDSTRRYKLCKADLERLYEEAKIAVLRDFSPEGEHVTVELLDKTTVVTPSSPLPPPPSSQSQSQSSASRPQAESSGHVSLQIPQLNLNFTSGHSEPEEEAKVVEEEKFADEKEQCESSSTPARVPEIIVTSPPISETYSPSAAEEDTQDASRSQSSSVSSQSKGDGLHNIDTSAEPIEARRETVLERNVQKFMELTQRFNAQQAAGSGLQRSLSDTQIADNGGSFDAHKSGKNSSRNVAQRNIAYYGAKAQKRPSMIVNVEIANSLSNASSILTAVSAMRNVKAAALSAPQTSCTTLSADSGAPVVSPGDFRGGPQRVDQDEDTTVSSKNNIPLSLHFSAADSSADNKQESVAKSKRGDWSSCTTAITTSEVSPNSNAEITCVSSTSSGGADGFAPDQVTASSNNHEQRIISCKITETSRASVSVSRLPQSAHDALLAHSNEHSTKTTCAEHANDDDGGTDLETYSYSYTFEADQTESGTVSSSCVRNSPPSATPPPTDSTLCRANVMRQATSTIPASGVLHTNSEAGGGDLLSETLLLDNCESNFENTVDDDGDEDDEIRLEDLSLPQFETTIETTHYEEETDDDDDNGEHINIKKAAASTTTTLSLQRERDFTLTSNRILSPKSKSLPPPPLPPASTLSLPPPPPQTPQMPSTSKDATVAAASSSTGSNNNNTSQQQLMPDIINELEPRRCQQPSQQQYEHVAAITAAAAAAVPYNMYVREIPNKPPPPYVPPAHGSPMTTIFPAEERIKDLTYRRTHELYCEMLKTEYTNESGEKLPSVLAEKITNIYERIILDICREYLEEHRDVLSKADPNTFHSPLAFFNPPNRLSCLQKFVYKEVRRCLAMDKQPPKRTQVYSVYGQRAKRDHIGQIIIQEMYDEDDKWCNFHREETEVLDLVIEEMIKNAISDSARAVLVEEGGQLEEIAVDPSDAGVDAVQSEEPIISESTAQRAAEPLSAISSSTTPKTSAAPLNIHETVTDSSADAAASADGAAAGGATAAGGDAAKALSVTATT